MDELAAAVAGALQSGDLAAITALMANDVRWGAPEQSVPTCRNKSQVLRWYENAQLAGASAQVIETIVLGEHIVLGVMVQGNPRAESPSPSLRWQVMSVKDGQVAEIRGYDSRGEAEEFARSGVSIW